MSDLLQRFKRNHLAVIGAIFIVALLIVAVLAPHLSAYSPTKIHMAERFQLPGLRHPLGTDELGRDILTRIIYGSRISLEVGVISVVIASIGGMTLGLIAGYRSGSMVDNVVMRITDVLFAFPAILLAIAIMAILGPSTKNVMIAIGIVNIPVFARITRASVINTMTNDFVEAARALGSRDGHVIRSHVIPNSLSPVIVQVSLTLASAILAEAALSFLGLGTQPPTPSWGSMLSTGREYMDSFPWLSVFPGIAIFLTVLSFNLVGDGLRDALDPKLKS